MAEQRGDAWVRYCPKCGKECVSSGRRAKYNCMEAERMGRTCKSCGASRGSGKDNPFYGKRHSKEMKNKMSLAAKERQSKRSESEKLEFKIKMRDVYEKHHAGKPRLSHHEYWRLKYDEDEVEELIAKESERKSRASSGKNNPMYGRPSPGGSGVGWKGWLDGKFFRSLRELRFMLDNPSAISAETNDWRAKFIWLNNDRTTVADFLILERMEVHECKPTRLHGTPLVQEKARAMRALAESRGWSFFLTDPGIVQYDDLKALIQEGRVRLTEKSKEIFDGNADAFEGSAGGG